MAEINHDYPYKTLGTRLKGMRERFRESLAEVSGAVEIELDALSSIEQGKARPSEDILLLLISHFAIKEDEATKLWELAGYEKNDVPGNSSMSPDEFNAIKHTVMVLPIDGRTVYTDMAHVVVNDHGVVLNFMQTTGPSDQPLTVARLGMSREHAQSVIALLQKTLLSHDLKMPKALPAPRANKDTEDAA